MFYTQLHLLLLFYRVRHDHLSLEVCFYIRKRSNVQFLCALSKQQGVACNHTAKTYGSYIVKHHLLTRDHI